MNHYEIIRWWWENNVEWIKIHDPWVIPLVALSIPMSLFMGTLALLLKFWRGK